MKTSEHLNELNSALALAQSKFKNVTPTHDVDMTLKSGRRVKYSYADLGQVLDSVRKPLTENGLSILQDVEYKESPFIITRLNHSSGQWIETSCPMYLPNDMGQNPMQTFGGIITYARRYSLSSILGIATDFDNDGAEAENEKQDVKKEIKNDIPNKADSLIFKVTQNQFEKILRAAEKMNIKKQELLKIMDERYRVKGGSQLNQEQYKDLCSFVGVEA